MRDCLMIILGVFLAGFGGMFFVRGSVGLAHWVRVSPALIGVTVAAFATSGPELAVGINAALAGKPEIALGDALGSNVVNIALILGLALMISGIRSPRDKVVRDFPVALALPGIIGILLWDGTLSRVDGLLLLGLFAGRLVAIILEAGKQRRAGKAGRHQGVKGRWGSLARFLAGVALLVTAGRLIVVGAKGLAVWAGWDAFVIGASIVALGTSIPELAMMLMSRRQGHEELGLGTILGSNIFNSLLIVGSAAVICPITVEIQEVAPALASGLLAVVLVLPSRSESIGRGRGIYLLALYAAYWTALFHFRP